jgi:hypothetical protein
MVPTPLPAPFLHRRLRHASLPQFTIYHISYCRSRILGVHCPQSYFGKSACGDSELTSTSAGGGVLGLLAISDVARSVIGVGSAWYLLPRAIFTLTMLI